jgi:putative hydrolase of the HAD superfamily
MVKGIIFDLDLCILDTHSLTGDFFKPVLDPLYESDLEDTFKKQINDLLWTTSLDDTAEILSIPEHVVEPMREAYRNLNVPLGIKSYGDESFIEALPVTKILVTSGYKKFQTQKIEMLGITSLFDEIIIDELDHRTNRKGKRVIFAELLAKYGWHPDEVLVVGDNPTSELKAAKALGIPTIQTLRATVVKWSEAEYHITSFSELPNIIG